MFKKISKQNIRSSISWLSAIILCTGISLTKNTNAQDTAAELQAKIRQKVAAGGKESNQSKDKTKKAKPPKKSAIDKLRELQEIEANEPSSGGIRKPTEENNDEERDSDLETDIENNGGDEDIDRDSNEDNTTENATELKPFDTKTISAFKKAFPKYKKIEAIADWTSVASLKGKSYGKRAFTIFVNIDDSFKTASIDLSAAVKDRKSIANLLTDGTKFYVDLFTENPSTATFPLTVLRFDFGPFSSLKPKGTLVEIGTIASKSEVKNYPDKLKAVSKAEQKANITFQK